MTEPRSTVRLLRLHDDATRFTDEAVQCLVGQRVGVGCRRVVGRVHRAWVEDGGREVWIEASMLEALVPDKQLAYSTPTQRAMRDRG